MSDQHELLDHAIETAIRAAVVDYKVNACPMAVRLAWHASGTFDKASLTGGSNGATMRFDPESSDGANAGLNIMRDILLPVKKQFPFASIADIWTRAGAFAVKFSGGPDVPFNYGRTDDADGARCPANGNLPDAAQGAQHLRDVFYRMGFNDREIVCLSGAHTLGRCHQSRSGFDGPWTKNPLKFDNSYFKNLMGLEWKPREWDGPLQYEDPSGQLMMLPTDIALKTDDSFRVFSQRYADDEQLFYKDFAAAFSKLTSLGCPAKVVPGNVAKTDAPTPKTADEEFREHAMHGSLKRMQDIGHRANPNSREPLTQRTALHKAAFWGHDHVVDYLISRRADVNAQDMDGATALHGAMQFGHAKCIELLRKAGASLTIKNNRGESPNDVASKYGKARL